MANTLECSFCGEVHEIDKYAFIQSCKGYMALFEFKKLEEEGIDGKKT